MAKMNYNRPNNGYEVLTGDSNGSLRTGKNPNKQFDQCFILQSRHDDHPSKLIIKDNKPFLYCIQCRENIVQLSWHIYKDVKKALESGSV